MDEDHQSPRLARATVAGITAASSTAVPPLAPVLAVLAPYAESALDDLLRRISEEREQRARYTLARALWESEASPEVFRARCEEDPRLRQLCTKVVLAARDSIIQGKLIALSRSLAAVVQDDALVDSETIFTQVIEQIETPHLRVLALLEQAPERDRGGLRTWAYSWKEIAELDPGVAGVIDPLLSTLTGTGLIVKAPYSGLASGGGGSHGPYQLTDFGQYTLDRIRDHEAS